MYLFKMEMKNWLEEGLELLQEYHYSDQPGGILSMTGDQGPVPKMVSKWSERYPRST